MSNYELLFESTSKFEEDLERFNNQERSKIIEKLNKRCATLKNGFKTFSKKVPLKIVLNNGSQPTLYSLRIDRDIRIILTVDDDPLFDQIIITLIRVVHVKDLEVVFRSIAESLYQKDIYSISAKKS
jgi:Txe/YoeB family toxin of Txe-Axe toxin-antitoxin module